MRRNKKELVKRSLVFQESIGVLMDSSTAVLGLASKQRLLFLLCFCSPFRSLPCQTHSLCSAVAK